jgi:hypothetical protein
VDEEEDEDRFTLPDDLSRDFPQAVFDWIKPTGLTLTDLLQHDYYFTPNPGRLYRLLGNSHAECRYLEHYGSHPKTRFFGSKSHFDGIIRSSSVDSRQPHHGQGGGTGRSYSQEPIYDKESSCANTMPQCQGKEGTSLRTYLTIVEDSLSAIKVARHTDSLPLFGSSVDNTKLARVTKGYNNALVWLDANKFPEAQSIAVRLALLGKNSRVVYTELDPKYCNIKEVLNEMV